MQRTDRSSCASTHTAQCGFSTAKKTPYLAMLVQLRPFFEEVPGTVNDLGTAFGFEFATSLWVLMGGKFSHT
jgi:hypothetical protein